MGFVRQMATTGKVPISEEVRKEVEMTSFHSIVTTIENKNTQVISDQFRSDSVEISPWL